VTTIDTAFWTSLVVDGTTATATTFLLALGLFVTYGLFRVVNMAHGDMVMLGAYMTSSFQTAGMGFLMAVCLATVTVALAALVMERICVGRLREQASLSVLLATWGFGLIIAQSTRLVAGSGGRFVDAPLSGQVEMLGSAYSIYQLSLVASAAVLFALIWYLLAHTRLGLRIRSCVDNRELAELHGINTRLLFTVTFCVGGALAGLAGGLLAPLMAVNPSIGSDFSVTSFMVLITGGLGKIGSAALGALVVGGLRSTLGALTTVTTAKLCTFLIVAVILAVRRQEMTLE